MPTYEYECNQCHHHFDAFQSMSSAAYTTCPKELCQMKNWGKGEVKRLIGAGAGFLFKGSGFYITDYRSQGYKNSAQKDAPSQATNSNTPETKSTKPSETSSPSPEKKVSEKKNVSPTTEKSDKKK